MGAGDLLPDRPEQDAARLDDLLKPVSADVHVDRPGPPEAGLEDSRLDADPEHPRDTLHDPGEQGEKFVV